MRILITGAAGYIGSVLTPRLLQAGHQVVALDNFMYRQQSLLDCCNHPQLEIIRGDARDSALLGRLVPRVDTIVPLACLTGAPLCARDPVGAETIIVGALQALLSYRSKNQALIYPTTNSGYGIGEAGILCTEETPLRPISLYGRLKVEAEKMLLDAGGAISLRLATVFGASPRMRTDLLVNDFVFRALHDRAIVLFEADFKRNFLHVRDAVDAFNFSLDNFARMQGQCYNVGLSEANLSKRELCLEIKRVIPELAIIDSPIGEDPDKRDYIVSNARIEAAGFRASRTLHAGIQELLRAYQILPRSFFGNL